MKYWRKYIGDYRRDTGTLTIAEHGVYSIMLDEYYALDGVLPLHLSELNQLCHARSKIEREAVMKIAQQYFPPNGDGRRHNARADKELSIAIPAIEKMRAAGVKSGKKRRGET